VGSGISPGRREELRRVVLTEEGHESTDKTELELGHLGSELYVFKPAKKAKDALDVKNSLKKWITDGATTIDEALAAQRVLLENGNVSPASVISMLQSGEVLLDDQAWEKWKSYRGCKPNMKAYRENRWSLDVYEWDEVLFIETVLIQIYLERYCHLFYESLSSEVLISRIQRLTLVPRGRLNDIATLYRTFMSLWRRLDDYYKKTRRLVEEFEHCVKASGIGDSIEARTNSGMGLWREVITEMMPIRLKYPHYSEERILEETVTAVNDNYRDTKQRMELARVSPSKGVASPSGAHSKRSEKSPKRASVRSTMVEALPGSVLDALVSIQETQQRDYEELSRLAGQSVAVRQVQTTAQYVGCRKCGSDAHPTGRCDRFTEQGNIKVRKVAEIIARSQDPDAALNRTLYSEWPRSDRMKSASKKTCDTLTKLVRQLKEAHKGGPNK